ncbi:MAG: hypothetical protein AAFP84_12635 [Actinomycetota bacterium]
MDEPADAFDVDSSQEWVDAMLAEHHPLPACAIDHLDAVRAANSADLRLVPDALELSAEEQLDRFYGANGKRWVANWDEVAWREADRRLQRAHASADAEAIELAIRALGHLEGTPRPTSVDLDPSPCASNFAPIPRPRSRSTPSSFCQIERAGSNPAGVVSDSPSLRTN